jgi:hypothetical protein
MNLTELTTELDALAREARPAAPAERLAGIRRKRRAQRARTAGAVAALGAAGVLGVAALPGLNPGKAHVPATGQTTGPHPVESEPVFQVAFDPDEAGDPLVAQGQVQGRDLDFGFRPRDADVAMTMYCRGTPATGGKLTATLSVNGHRVAAGDCSSDDAPGTSVFSKGDAAAANRAGWSDLGMVPGRETSVRVVVSGDGEVAEIGAGVYERSGTRITRDGVILRERISLDGRDYRIDSYRTLPITGDARTLELPVPAGPPGSGAVLSGVGGEVSSDEGKLARTRIDGREVDTSSAGGITTTAVGTRPSTASVTVDPGLTGTMVVAYYTAEG